MWLPFSVFVVSRYMDVQNKHHAQLIAYMLVGVIIDEGVQTSRYEQTVTKASFAEFADISRCLTLPVIATKRASKFTIAVLLLHSTCLFAFASLRLQNIDCTLLDPRTLISHSQTLHFLKLQFFAQL